MKWPLRALAITVVVALLAGFAGTMIGNRLSRPAPPPSVHELVHHELDLSPAQAVRIDALEADFAVRRATLERELRAANAELAAAIAREKGYGPGVTAAVDHFHHVMGRLQKQTLEHVFRMRAVLDPGQAARFDRTVVKALTADAG